LFRACGMEPIKGKTRLKSDREMLIKHTVTLNMSGPGLWVTGQPFEPRKKIPDSFIFSYPE
jgi:hypothetical protein